jgi:hypothetical protein
MEESTRDVAGRSVVCAMCGGVFRRITNTHLRRHGLTVARYRQDILALPPKVRRSRVERLGEAQRSIASGLQYLARYVSQRR